MTLPIKKMHECFNYHNILVKGPPMSGKSWFTAHLPNVIIIDFDKNQERLKRLPSEIKNKIQIIDPTVDSEEKEIRGRLVYDNLLKILDEIKRTIKNHTIVIDSLTAIEPFILKKIAGSEDPQVYGDLSFKNGRYQTLATYWDAFFELVTKSSGFKNHAVVIAHEISSEEPVDINDKTYGEKRLKLYPSMTGQKTYKNVEKYFSDVFKCYTDIPPKGKARYMITVSKTEVFNAGTSLDLPDVFEASSQFENIAKQLSFKPLETDKGGSNE